MQPGVRLDLGLIVDFYSRTSCEVQPTTCDTPRGDVQFLLTHLMRGATFEGNGALVDLSDFYSRTSCEVQLKTESSPMKPLSISTHAPHARCNFSVDKLGDAMKISTHAPHARCNNEIFGRVAIRFISTHAPHARCNHLYYTPQWGVSHFYSRTSCEVQLPMPSFPQGKPYFYSRTSCEVQLMNFSSP